MLTIQNLLNSGQLSDYPDLLQLLRVFEQNTLMKLFLRALAILQKLNGGDVLFTGNPFGEFDGADFANYDFDDSDGYLMGDFSSIEFTSDFRLNYLGAESGGMSGLFETILNILHELERKADQISTTDIAGLDAALIYVINGFEYLELELTKYGFSPCVPDTSRYFNNATDVYLQAAGSDGTDKTAKGIHLRWSLAGDLGLNHIPKGNYDNTTDATAPFNQPNDFILISRTPYAGTVPFTIDFSNIAPIIDYASKTWTYAINSTINGKLYSNRLTLTFTDAAAYNQLAVTTNPTSSYFNFLKAYTGIIQLAVAGKSLFRGDFSFSNGVATPANVKIEAVCIADTGSANAVTVYARKTTSVAANTTATVTMLAENIRSISFLATSGTFLRSFSFETYSDFFLTRANTDWTAIGAGFALSLNEQEVFDRLETTAYPIDGLWPQYNYGTSVKVANYHDKWSISHENDPSISDIITNYLTLSETDSRAIMTLDDQSINPDPSGLQISLVDILNMAATDFHIARMLGLGWIDVTANESSQQFIYKLQYANKTSLTVPAPLQRIYLTLPTGINDSILPLTPQIRPLTYGMPSANNTASTAFNASGYANDRAVRAINIGRQPFIDEVEGYNFFADLTAVDNTNIFLNTRPVSYDIKYRPATQSVYTKPGITYVAFPGTEYYANDTNPPSGGMPETVLVPDNESSLFVHLETNSGVHYYAIYGINWFSRASAISAEVATDDTEFPVQNRLSPPTDVAVQYIQDEDPILLTTGQEQSWLAAREAAFAGEDTSFTRFTFNWLDITDITSLPDHSAASLIAVPKPDKVNIWFNQNLPIEIQGAIRNILPVPGQPGQVQLITGPYTRIDGTILSPVINSADFFRFSNSLLNTSLGQFPVVEITSGTTGPIITVSKILQSSTVEDSQTPGNYGLVQGYQSPAINSQFSMVENLSNAANWAPVAEKISLYSFADANNPVIESFTDPEGNVTQNWIGGISEPATATALFSGADLTTDLPGCYQLDFQITLTPNPQVNDPSGPGNAPGTLHTPHVEWYKGLVRITPASGADNIKQLQVLTITQSDSGNLRLIIYDPDYQDDPIPVSSGSATISVNFHPGYRAYVFPEPSPGTFNGSNILPAGSQVSRKTMVGLQTADTRTSGNGFTSSVSLPAILLARLIVTPVRLTQPTAVSYMVRPNATGKAAFTFDTAVNTSSDNSVPDPFGFQFFRTSDADVFDALYQDSTIGDIITAVGDPTTDPGHTQRYNDLVNLVMDNDGHFLVYNGYKFPDPDKAGLVEAADTPEVKKQKYTAAILGTILPLTQNIPIFQFLNPGYQTDNIPPAIRDANGTLLYPGTPGFNPFPMVSKFTRSSVPDTTFIRFTDYTLNASSRRLYFYAAAEVTNQLVAGPLSLFAGPVTIINTTPPEAPIIRNFSITPSAAGVVSPISIVFQLSPTAPYDNITAMRFYRTTNLALTNSLSTMGTPFEVPAIADPNDMSYLITDTFEDITNIPFGDLMYYRIASVRTITNEFNQPEDVVSIASDLVTVTLIDTVNPTAPQLTYDPPTNKLHWTTTVNKGTYYVYQQNAKGNWNLLGTDQTAQPGHDVAFQLQPLTTTDGNGNTVYNRFKVRVQNASGLFNLTDNIKTV